MSETSRVQGKGEPSEESGGENIPQFVSEREIGSKTYIRQRDEWHKSDGNIMLTFTNMRMKLLHIQDNNGNLFTDVIAQFDQYNNTENDRGNHHCTMRLFVYDTNGTTLAVPYPNIILVRDDCGRLATRFLPQVRLGTDFFDSAGGFNWDGYAEWDYEGGC